MHTADVTSLWNSYADLLWEPGRHKETCRAYVAELQAIIDRRRLTVFDSEMVDAITASLRAKGNRNSTVNRKLACLSKLVRKHVRTGALARMPDIHKLPERNGRIRFLSRDEESWLFAGLELIDTRYGNLARFLVDSGARVGEAIGLAWSDVQGRNATFWETKAHTPRTVPLTERAIRAVESRRGAERIGPFASVRYPNFRNAWLRARQKAGLSADPQVVPHILRHTCASRLAQSGVDIKRIQEFLGHKTLAMTLRYAHLAPRHLEVCAEALDKFALLEAAE